MNKKVKHKLDNYLDSMTLDEATSYINFEAIDLAMNGKKDQKFSIAMKKVLFLVVGLSFPVLMELVFIQEISGSKHFLFPKLMVIVIELFIIGLMVYQFLKPCDHFLQNWNYKNYCYTIAKLAYLSYFVVGFGMDDGNYMMTFLLFALCILVFLFLYYKVEKNMILEEINLIFNKNYKTSKVMNMLLKLSAVIVVLILISTQLYRLNKWWLEDFTIEKLVAQSSSIDDLIGIFVGIPLLLAITLIPTYLLFNAKHYIQGKVISRYSEEFRERYDYTKQEWYGE